MLLFTTLINPGQCQDIAQVFYLLVTDYNNDYGEYL